MSRRRVVTVVRVAIAVLTLAAVVYAVVTNWTAVSTHLGEISLGTFLLSSLAALAGTWLTMIGWRVVLADLGSPLHLAPASGVWFVGQLGKYLPGSLWAVLVQAEIASNLKVPRRRTAVAGLLALGFSLLTGVVVGLPAASLLLRRPEGGFDWWTLLALPVVAVLLVPRILNRLVDVALRLLRRAPLGEQLSGAAVAKAVGIYVLVWITFGVHTLLLARAVGGPGPHPDLWVATLSGYPLSVALGMLTVVLPAGLGAREGLLTLVLATAIPTTAAGTVAIVSRFIVTLVDIACALFGWLYARQRHLITDRRPEELAPHG